LKYILYHLIRLYYPELNCEAFLERKKKREREREREKERIFFRII